MKRILAIFITLCMLITCVPFAAMAEDQIIGGTFTDEQDTPNTFTWSLNLTTGALAIDGKGAMTIVTANPWDVSKSTTLIPWAYYGEEKIDYRSAIKSISIGSGITSLGRELFYGCTSLEEVTVPGNISHSGGGLFMNCTSLKKATLAEGFKDTGDKIFMGCTALTELNLPNSLSHIRQNIVQGCTSLKTLTLPAGLTFIHQNAFGDNKGGTDGAAVIPAPAGNIGHSLKFTVSKYSLAEEYLNMYYPGTIENVIDAPLASGEFGLDNEGNESGLKWDIYGTTLYVTRKTDDKGAFVGSGKMPNFTAGKATPWADNYRTNITKAVFENGVTRIGERCLEEHTALTTVTMANTVTVMGAYCMNASPKVASLKLSDNLVELTTGVLNNNTALTELTIPFGTKVTAGSFRKVSNQLVLNIYQGSKSYAWATGEGSSEGKTPVIMDKDYGLSYNVLEFLGGSVSDDGKVTWTLDDGVLTISGEGEIPNYSATADEPWSAYRSDITKVIIADGITRIGNRAFQECSALTSIEIADSVMKMGEYVFNACGKLASVKLSANTEKIMSGTFNNAKSLKELNIPSKTAVEANSFTKTPEDIRITVYAGSTAHKTFGDDLTIDNVINVDNTNGHTRKCELIMTESGVDNNTTWTWDYATKTITIGGEGGTTRWHTDANNMASATWHTKRGYFAYAAAAEKVVIGSDVTTLGDYAFMQFGALKEVEFAQDSKLERIGSYAFSNTVLTEVTIPASVKSVTMYAFRASNETDTTTHTLTKFVVSGNDTILSDTALARQSNVTVYCNLGSKAAETALKNNINYRLMDADYSIELYSKTDKKASILNSTDASKEASVIFVNYVGGVIDDISVESTTLATGINEVAAAEDFAKDGAGIVAVYLWDKITPLAKSYMKNTVWMLGDSIMADWPDARYPQEGWGEAFKDVVTENLVVKNRAISGYTAETCYKKIWSTNQARSDWNPVRDEVCAGDYVIIAYLHNDYCAVADPSKNNGLYQSTEYINEYRNYIETIADECADKGAQIILVVPPNRGSTTNFHNQPVNGVDVGDYSAVIPAIAEERGLPCVNIHKWTLEEANKDASFLDTIYLTKNYIYDLIEKGEFTEEALNSHSNSGLAKNHNDHTHLSILGCKNVAEYVASQLKTMDCGIKYFLK